MNQWVMFGVPPFTACRPKSCRLKRLRVLAEGSGQLCAVRDDWTGIRSRCSPGHPSTPRSASQRRSAEALEQGEQVAGVCALVVVEHDVAPRYRAVARNQEPRLHRHYPGPAFAEGEWDVPEFAVLKRLL